MKLIIFFIILALFQFNVSASTLVKTFDGGVARCQDLSDVGLRAYQLYLLNETDSITHKKLDFEVRLLTCSSNFKFRRVSLSESVAVPFFNDKTGKIDYIFSQFSETKLVGFSEMGKMMGKVLLNENERGDIRVSMSIPHSKRETPMILNLESVVTITNSNSEELMRERMVAYTFLLHFR
jgi:hypothetical protein